MMEPDVTLTDYALALESVLFLVLLRRGRARPERPRSWFSLFFGSVSAASLCGGTVHGFFLDEHTLGYAILWPTTLLILQAVALFLFFLGGRWLVNAERGRPGKERTDITPSALPTRTDERLKPPSGDCYADTP